jgi:hypothetical protein
MVPSVSVEPAEEKFTTKGTLPTDGVAEAEAVGATLAGGVEVVMIVVALELLLAVSYTVSLAVKLPSVV